ncbi:MAG: protein kinase [Acidobacteriota bacterium]|nr:protein kinase [Acidobacteriota bacterium]
MAEAKTGDLEVGKSLSHYRILKKIGEGGMGEVYLAEDARLRRKVALKLLPENIASNKERLHRFEQEAYAASALNHPNILTIYEFSATGGRHFLATEYIEGETLREKLKNDELSLADVLSIAEQIAFALSAAHAAGIVHRDLKPENVMIRRDGIVKVLDFGLAKLIEKKQISLDNEAETRALVQTNPGAVMGTVAYMSPEQARGKDTDERTDIWSLGVLIYEMVTRHLPFTGETTSDVIAAILTREPSLLSHYVKNAPAELQRILGKILRKNRDERYQHIKDLWIDLKDLRQELEFTAKLERSAAPNTSQAGEIKRDANAQTQILTEDKLTGAAASAVSTKDLTANDTHPTSSAEYIVGSIKRNKTAAILALTLFVIVLAGVGYGIYRLIAKQDKPALSFQSAKITRLTTTGKASGVGISPDGKYVVHVQIEGGQQSLWMRQVATQSNVQIVAPAPVFYADSMTFSPDGNYVYYNITSQDYPQRALFQVPTLGGTPKKLLENINSSPITFSPDGKQFAFVRNAPGKESALMIANADGTNEQKLVTVKNPPEAILSSAWSPDGKRIAYVAGNFDSNNQTIFETQVADGSTKPLTAQRWLRVSRLAWLADGSGLLMLATPGQSFVYQIWHLSYPEGEARQLTNDLNDYRGMSLAADSNTLSVVQSETQASIWIMTAGDVSRARPVTSGSGKADNSPAWTPDGRIVYHSNASGNNDIWITNADGGNPKQLTANARVNQAPAVSPDGRYIVFHSDRAGVPHLWRMKLDGSDQQQLTNGASGEQNAQFSPDGRWIVYRTIFGRATVWKIPADGGEPVQLTDKISRLPTISPDGKLVAYLFRPDDNAPWRVAVVQVDGGEPLKTFDVSPATPLLRWTPDGRAVAYIDSKNGVSNIFAQPLDGGAPKQLTDFKADSIFSFAFSPDGKQLALSRGTVNNDVVLISNFK